MWWSTASVIIAIFLIYCLIPNYWVRNHSSKVLRKDASGLKQIALTFDDGPHPNYTPTILDILKDFNVTATFFLVGQQASLYPDLVLRMKKEGHAVGCHSFSHVHAWLMPPWTIYRDIYKTYEILNKILEQPPKWYRPPWGGFNLLSLPIARRLKLQPTYWSVEAQDWDAKITADHIYQTVIRQSEPGSIVVLHDNGGAPNAPERTLKALPLIIKTLQNQGYTFVTLDEIVLQSSQ